MNPARYREDGYWIERGLIAHDLCDAAVRIAHARADTLDFKPLHMPHRDGEFFLSMMRHKPVTECVRACVGSEISGLGSEYFFHAPGTKGFTTHQDNFWVQAPRGAFIHAWIALSEVTPESGGMVFWPKSHSLDLLPLREIHEEAGAGQNPTARNVEIDVPSGFVPLDITMSPGDVVFWDSHLIHRSGTNTTDRFRDALLLTYIKTGSPFNRGNRQKREEVPLS